jgi:hypothetical protein
MPHFAGAARDNRASPRTMVYILGAAASVMLASLSSARARTATSVACRPVAPAT